MYISIKRHSWFFQSWWCLLYFGHVQTRTISKCWRQKTPFCLKLSAHAQWHQKPPFCLKLSTHAQESVLSWSISMSRILGTVIMVMGLLYTLLGEAVFPLMLYVAKLAQHFGKLAQQILWKCVKKMLFLVSWANFHPWSYHFGTKAPPILGNFVELAQAQPGKLKNFRGNTEER